jgi:hypothetical protein
MTDNYAHLDADERVDVHRCCPRLGLEKFPQSSACFRFPRHLSHIMVMEGWDDRWKESKGQKRIRVRVRNS